MQVLTWGDINGPGKHRHEGVEGVLVEGMDLVEGVEEEEEHGSTGSHRPVLVAVLVDALLCLPRLDHLLADLVGHPLGLLQGLNECHILCDVALCCAQLEQQLILQLQHSRESPVRQPDRKCMQRLQVM